MDVQMPVRKPFATEYLTPTEENGALGNIFTELYETLGFLERNYQSTPGCTEQIKNLLTGSPLVSLPKTMDFSFYDQAQHEINVEQQPSYFETSLNNSKGTWMPMEVPDQPSVQYNHESMFVRKPDRALYEENRKTNENQQNIVSSSAPLLPRKRKMDVIAQESKLQIMCNIPETPIAADNSSRILQEQFKNNSKYSNLSRIGWPSEDLSLTDDDDLDASYNISDALLSLSSLTNMKQESATSKLVQNRPVIPDTHEVNSLQKGIKDKNDENVCFQELLHGTQTHELNNCKMPENTQNTTVSLEVPSHIMNKDAKDCRFQYVLGAATSIATKTNEESLTYLNQRQSYEIKLKKLGDLTAYKGKILKTIIRICFHERRLQFMEREQIKLWKEAHPGEKIIDIDIPLSYGLHRIAKQSTDNSVELFWDPMKETGIYIKVNCISTEFTPKKHGGEKGVPFRIQVETYLSKTDDNFQESTTGDLLHAAFCQIRVFKLKGADRKHKQDRDKILKRSPLEQKRYKPSCECTILNNMSCDLVLANYPQVNHVEQRTPDHANSPSGACTEVTSVPMAVKSADVEITNNSAVNSPASVHSESLFNEGVPLCQDTNTERMSQWLQNNRFSAYLTTFSHFSGSDIWSLSREDLIQICGVPDGIRLYNSLHTKIKSVPCLTFYVCSDASSPCNAIYMQTLTAAEFIFKVRQFITTSKAAEINTTNDDMNNSYLKLPFYVLGPGGIHVVLTNELIANIHEKTIFAISVEQDKVILKTINKHE